MSAFGHGLVEKPGRRARRRAGRSRPLRFPGCSPTRTIRARSLALAKHGLGRPLVEVAGGARTRLLSGAVESETAWTWLGDRAWACLPVTHAPLIGKSHASRSCALSRRYLPSSWNRSMPVATRAIASTRVHVMGSRRRRNPTTSTSAVEVPPMMIDEVDPQAALVGEQPEDVDARRSDSRR